AGIRRNGILFPIDAYEGARYVARHCTFKHARVGGTGTENQGRGTKEAECYNNTFVSTEPIESAQSCPSGTSLVHDNLETNYRESRHRADLSHGDITEQRQCSGRRRQWREQRARQRGTVRSCRWHLERGG